MVLYAQSNKTMYFYYNTLLFSVFLAILIWMVAMLICWFMHASAKAVPSAPRVNSHGQQHSDKASKLQLPFGC